MVLLTGAVSDVAGVHAALARSTAMNDTVKLQCRRDAAYKLWLGRLHPPNPFQRLIPPFFSARRVSSCRGDAALRRCGLGALNVYEGSAGRLGRLRQLLGQKRKPRFTAQAMQNCDSRSDVIRLVDDMLRDARREKRDVDARDKPGHDGGEVVRLSVVIRKTWMPGIKACARAGEARPECRA